MKKIKLFLKSTILSFMLLGFLGAGFLASPSFFNDDNTANGEVLQAQNISNQLPEFVEFTPTSASISKDKTTYLLSDNGNFNLSIANDEIDAKFIENNGTQRTGQNYAYQPDKNNTSKYYYFDFQSSLSLYYNMTNTQVENSKPEENLNLLFGEKITSFTSAKENGVPIQSNPSVIPLNLSITFKLNPNIESGCKVSNNEIELKEAGIYTIAIPYFSYYTEDGVNFSSSNDTIYYTFAVFNSGTYFNRTTGIANVEPSNNFQTTSMPTSSVYSRTYFYNFASANSITENNKIKLPTYSFDPSKYQLEITYTDKDERKSFVFTKFDFDEKKILFLNADGQEVNDLFLLSRYDNNTGLATLTFKNVGIYEFKLNYTYMIEGELYNLPFENMEESSITINTKRQRVILYGYQLFYTDYDNKNELTGTTEQKEFNEINEEASILEQFADITPFVSKKMGFTAQNPSQQNNYTIESLWEATQFAIEENNLEPVSTNQPPIKYLTNANLQNLLSDNTDLSGIYKKENGKWSNTPSKFYGFNENSAGTYAVIIQYTYDNYLSVNGAGQSKSYHYQVFYFTIESKTPTVSVLTDTSFAEVYTKGYTNQGVYIIDNSSSSLFDASVEITLSAYDYVAKRYFYQDRNIKDLNSIAGMRYYADNLTIENTDIENVTGLYIPNDSPYANAKFTIKIKSETISTPSERSFTIDTTDIQNLMARNVDATSSSNYSIDNQVTSNKTNRSMIFSWSEKVSGAPTYGYYRFIPMEEIKYYSSGDNNLLLYSLIVRNKTVATNYSIDLSKFSNWTSYQNTVDMNQTIGGTYVKSASGLYIIEVYDEAGNANFETYLLDKSSPLFVQKRDEGTENYSIFSPYNTLPISETYEVTVEWGEKKGIILQKNNDETLNKICTTYQFDNLLDEQKSKLRDTFNKFLDENTEYLDINVNKGDSDVDSYKSDYITIPITGTVFIKEYNSDEYKAFEKSNYKIEFFKRDTEGNPIEPLEGTYQFLLRDEANSQFKGNDIKNSFLNYPSAFLSINTTSDISQMKISILDKNGEDIELKKAAFSHSGNYFNITGEGITEENGIFSKSDIVTSGQNATKTARSYKNSYYTPARVNKTIYLSYIPYTDELSTIENITLYYYPYIKVSKIVEKVDGNGNKYLAKNYYYTLSENATEISVFKHDSSKNYVAGQKESFIISFNSDNLPSAGKYVVRRTYNSETTQNFDYYERDISLTIDNYNVISEQETVTIQVYQDKAGKNYFKTEEILTRPVKDDASNLEIECFVYLSVDGSKVYGNGEDFYLLNSENKFVLIADRDLGTIKNNTSLESIVGGDILLSMFSGEGNSSIQVSLPSYSKDTGLNNGSLFTQEWFTEYEEPKTLVVETNKLPLSINIPTYKYTTGTSYNNGNNSFSTDINNPLSAYSNARIEKVELENQATKYNVVINDEITGDKIILKSYYDETEAINYINNNNCTIEQYKLYAEITYTGINNEKLYYQTNKNSFAGNFLNFYQVEKLGDEIISTSKPVTFSKAGTYQVTIYQAYNEGSMTGSELPELKSFYKFKFQIKEAYPEFDILNSQNIELNTYNLSNSNKDITAYTNDDIVKFRWFDSTSDFVANIDKTKISYTTYNGIQTINQGYISPDLIKTNKLENTLEFNLNDLGLWKNGNFIEVEMQFEGHNDEYYTTTRKKVVVDYSAPLDNLSYLMDNLASAANFFPRLSQEKNMRTLHDYKQNIINTNSWNDYQTNLEKVSFSYSNSDGIFKYYSYTVDKAFFTELLPQSLNKNPTGVNKIYYRAIDYKGEYKQVTRNSFSEGNYRDIDNIEDDKINLNTNEYFEIVEFDRAMNMAVYVVHLNTKTENENAQNNIAISYENARGNAGQLTDNEIDTTQEQINIYSNSGFEITNLNYNDDSWGYYQIKLGNEIYSNTYLASPWLDNGMIYRIGLSNYTPVSISELFKNITSSDKKHSLTVLDRYNAVSKEIFISIMDANLITNKTNDVSGNPVLEIYTEIDNERATIFPVKIEIQQYVENNWTGVYIGENSNLSWPNNDFVTFDYQSGILKITVNIGESKNGKLKYIITDNFGNKTTIIQLSDEETCKEVVDSTGYEMSAIASESDGSITYLSSKTLRYQFNNLIHRIIISKLESDGSFKDITSTSTRFDTVPNTKNISYYEFTPIAGQKNYDNVYRVKVYELENSTRLVQENTTPVKVINIRIYNKLPELSKVPTDNNSNLIYFKDKNDEIITDFGQDSYNTTIDFNGTAYTTKAYSITTYSDSMTVHFDNGQYNQADGKYSYLDQYSYSVYFSRDNGTSWININEFYDNFRFSGAGDYLFLIKYDNDEFLTDNFKLIKLTILNSSSIFYYITVDGIQISKALNNDGSNKIYTSKSGKEYDTNYFVSIPYNDRDSHLKIYANEELGVKCNLKTTEATGTNVFVEIYEYTCDYSNGHFTIIYIPASNDILKNLDYVSVSNITTTLINPNQNSEIIAVSKEKAKFDSLKISWTGYYGIKENLINVRVSKLNDGVFKDIHIDIYQEGDQNYIYLDKAGSYHLEFRDSSEPANIHRFGLNNFYNLVFLNSVPFLVSSVDEVSGEEITSEPVERAIYNNEVKIRLVDLNAYFNASGYPTISVTRNGEPYTNFTHANYVYAFKEPGYYKVKFSATYNYPDPDKAPIELREKEFTFTIINKNESNISYQISPYANYYIEKVLRYENDKADAIDITEILKTLFKKNVVVVNGKQYLNTLLLSNYDDKTGTGRYEITVNTGTNNYKEITAQSFKFDIWINDALPPIEVSIAEGQTTSDTIMVRFNPRNLFNAIGDSYIKIDSKIWEINAETIETLPTTLSITNAGVHYIQVYTASGNLLYSYKVVKKDPLNVWAIIAIVIGVLAAIAIVIITIKLRKRLKVK